jgi:hypothetical protein
LATFVEYIESISMYLLSMFKKIKNFIFQFYFSFPIQLVVLHFKRNHLLLVFWFFLFAFSNGWIASNFGVQALFLYPEYFNHSDALSFFILGVSFGGFMVAFHLYSYILHGSRFRFIATVRKPFLVFSYNNMIIPLLFIFSYLSKSYAYQLDNELVSRSDSFYNLSAFIGGLAVFTFVSYVYFVVTNKNFLSIKKKEKMGAFQSSIHRGEAWSSMQNKVQAWKVTNYFVPVFKMRIARNVKHYQNEWIDEIINQNHVNASIFEIVAVISFFVIGIFSANAAFLIPAAASVFLAFTILLMIISAFFSWMKGWTMTVIVIIITLINVFSDKVDWLNIKSLAYGLDYKVERTSYSNETIWSLNDNLKRERDLKEMEELMDLRKSHFTHDSIMVVINVSGGGHRSSAWTFATLFKADSLLNGELYRHSYMISGASGGMIGASYWREVEWRKNLDRDPYFFNEHFEALASDLLNPIIFTLVSNDFSLRFRKSSLNGVKYTHDRAFAFENQLNENTHHWFDVPLKNYKYKELNAEMPMMIFTPTILNDGRRLLISPLNLSFLTYKNQDLHPDRQIKTENIDFQSFFKNQDASNLRYLSLLRMNATFPYILPAVTLPSNPEIEVMDAGIRDNFGKETTYEFLTATKDWINKNINKIVVIQIRYRDRLAETEAIDQSILSRLSTPVGVIYDNFENVQEYGMDDLLNEMEANLKADVEWVNFELNSREDDPISLNFHLSELEKKFILSALERRDNKKSFDRLEAIFTKNK